MQIQPLGSCRPSSYNACRIGEMYHVCRGQSSPQGTMGCWVMDAVSNKQMMVNQLKHCTEIGASLGL